ncbi:uncharacterized protein LOC127752182 [Frankliniella occidentalis]|uniref:Uncharacterized protein LOC127752182 n=1 Tax=Frankliniella occidentalis TaxID=133901 RepID=A0A9C6XW65_FRAOC|nr:uncharacterized protein LOC127752182 [Frankliniella occidentalis]
MANAGGRFPSFNPKDNKSWITYYHRFIRHCETKKIVDYKSEFIDCSDDEMIEYVQTLFTRRILSSLVTLEDISNAMEAYYEEPRRRGVIPNQPDPPTYRRLTVRLLITMAFLIGIIPSIGEWGEICEHNLCTLSTDSKMFPTRRTRRPCKIPDNITKNVVYTVVFLLYSVLLVFIPNITIHF